MANILILLFLATMCKTFYRFLNVRNGLRLQFSAQTLLKVVFQPTIDTQQLISPLGIELGGIIIRCRALF
jgi:hypothetical protein